MNQNQPTPEVALKNLISVAESYSCNGQERDILRASAKVLEEMIQAAKIAALPTVTPSA